MRKRDHSSLKQLIKCICPGCNRKHKMRLHWIGDIPAKKYCLTCRKKAEEFSRSSIDSISFSMTGRDVIYRLSRKEGL